MHYIDVFLFCASTQEEALRIRDVVLHDIMELGLAPNFKKSMGVPAQRVKFLGFVLDSKTMHMSRFWVEKGAWKRRENVSFF